MVYPFLSSRHLRIIPKSFCWKIFVFFIFSSTSHAAEFKNSQQHFKEQINPEVSATLSAHQRQRLKECKGLLEGADGKSFQESLHDLEESSDPTANLLILETVARTFEEIVKEQDVTERQKKEWLHSMIILNMAFLQLAGLDARQPQDTPLDKMIQRKLKKYLAPELKNRANLFRPLE